jgi:hypothetical protein
MANLQEIFFLIQFALFMTLFLYKLYSIMTAAEKTEFPLIMITFILSIITYAVGFVVTLLSVDNLYMSMLLKLQTWMLPLMIIFLFSEIVLKLRSKGVGQTRKPYNATALKYK